MVWVLRLKFKVSVGCQLPFIVDFYWQLGRCEHFSLKFCWVLIALQQYLGGVSLTAVHMTERSSALLSLLQVKPQIAQHCKAKAQVCAAGKKEMWQGKHKGL